MYLDEIIKDEINYVNIVTILKLPHEIILNTKDYFLIYFPEGGIYYAGCDEKSGKEEELCNKIKELNYKVLTTPSEKVSKGLNSKFSRGYLQFIYRGEEIKESESKLTILRMKILNMFKKLIREVNIWKDFMKVKEYGDIIKTAY